MSDAAVKFISRTIIIVVLVICGTAMVLNAHVAFGTTLLIFALLTAITE